jgi:cleavage and polyadenylation specificity factor subunit 1
LGLAQIYPVWDDDSSDERVAVSASLADPYLAIICDDSTLLLLQADKSGDLDEVTVDGLNQKWLSACLYSDKTGFFAHPEDHSFPNGIFLFLLSPDYQLYVSARELYVYLGH